ncbi:hypothetical protein FBDF15_13680 [Faecalibacterium duncaniae]
MNKDKTKMRLQKDKNIVSLLHIKQPNPNQKTKKVKLWQNPTKEKSRLCMNGFPEMMNCKVNPTAS